MSLKIAFYFLLALSCGLALAKEEEPEAVIYKLENDGAEEQDVFVAADFFNDSSSVKDEVTDQADDDAEASTEDSDKRKVVSTIFPLDWKAAQIYPIVASGARADTIPPSIPSYPLLPATPNKDRPSFPHFPPPLVLPYPYYPYPYYGIPFPPPPPPPPPTQQYPYPGPPQQNYPYPGPPQQNYPYPGQVYSHSHSTSTPTTSRPIREKRKYCKEIFPIGKVCKVDFE